MGCLGPYLDDVLHLVLEVKVVFYMAYAAESSHPLRRLNPILPQWRAINMTKKSSLRKMHGQTLLEETKLRK